MFLKKFLNVTPTFLLPFKHHFSLRGFKLILCFYCINKLTFYLSNEF